jgi:inosose dehydratase
VWFTGRDDFAGLERGFIESKRAGFDGVEVPAIILTVPLEGRPVRTDLDVLHRLGRILALSEKHALPLTAIFTAGDFMVPEIREAEIDHVTVLARLASTAGITHLPMTIGMDHVLQGAAEMRELAEILSAVGAETLRHGVRLAVHPHIDSAIETPDHIEAFFTQADPRAVGMCFDAGHIAAGGGDPVAVAQTFADRITYVHLKDLDPTALRQAGTARQARYAAFRDPGVGNVDFIGVQQVLDAAGYAGPILAELDVSPDPVASVHTARAYLRDVLGL